MKKNLLFIGLLVLVPTSLVKTECETDVRDYGDAKDNRKQSDLKVSGFENHTNSRIYYLGGRVYPGKSTGSSKSLAWKHDTNQAAVQLVGQTGLGGVKGAQRLRKQGPRKTADFNYADLGQSWMDAVDYYSRDFAVHNLAERWVNNPSGMRTNSGGRTKADIGYQVNTYGDIHIKWLRQCTKNCHKIRLSYQTGGSGFGGWGLNKRSGDFIMGSDKWGFDFYDFKLKIIAYDNGLDFKRGDKVRGDCAGAEGTAAIEKGFEEVSKAVHPYTPAGQVESVGRELGLWD